MRFFLSKSDRFDVLSKLDLMTEDEFEDAIFKGLEDMNAD